MGKKTVFNPTGTCCQGDKVFDRLRRKLRLEAKNGALEVVDF